jgi:high-affinity nickel-transport protein
MIHGLAGSAGITLLALTTIRSRPIATLYLGLFGLGTVAGMLLVTALLSLPLGYAARRSASLYGHVVLASAVLSIGFGMVLGMRVLWAP